MTDDQGVQQQNPDGTWSRAQPLGWAPGLDWEVCTLPNGRRRAELYDKATLLATVESRSRLVLELRMRRARRRATRP